ncbi:MAG: thioredoxin domain-containing protein [Luteolibacter sp.]
MNRFLVLLPLVVPFLGSCDHIDAVSEKVNELKDLRKESVTGTEGVGLNELLGNDPLESLQGGPSVTPIGEVDFEQFIAQPGKLNIVDFHANWCGPCKTLGPILEQVVSENGMTTRLGTFDVDQAKEFAREQGVSGIPDVRFYIDGKMVDRFVGGESKGRVEELVAKHTADIIPANDFAGLLNAGIDNLGKPKATAENVPARPQASNAKPLDEAMAPMKGKWLPPGMSRK